MSNDVDNKCRIASGMLANQERHFASDEAVAQRVAGVYDAIKREDLEHKMYETHVARVVRNDIGKPKGNGK